MKLPDLHDRKTQLTIGGAAAVAAFALYKKHQAAAAGAAASNTATGATTDQVATAAFDASSIENNIVGDLQPQIDKLAGDLSGLQAQKPTPGPPGPAGPPGPPAKPPTSTPTSLPPINHAAYPVKISKNGLPGDPLVDLGIIGPGAKFTGMNVKGGAPVYAIVGDYAIQDWDPKKLPVGTHLATLKNLAAYIVPGKVTEQL